MGLVQIQLVFKLNTQIGPPKIHEISSWSSKIFDIMCKININLGPN